MSEDAGESWDVFLSYSRSDTEFMRNLCADLRSEGFRVWIDEGLDPGTKRWEEEVERAVERARAIVTILSPASKQSLWVGRELSYGEGRGSVSSRLSRKEASRSRCRSASALHNGSTPGRITSVRWNDFERPLPNTPAKMFGKLGCLL